MQVQPSGDRPARFYQLILQEDLLGGWTLVRQWGMVGQRGTMRREYFDDLESATEAMTTQRKKQIRDGFSVMYVEGEDAP